MSDIASAIPVPPDPAALDIAPDEVAVPAPVSPPARIIAIANQKGGVGKSTTAVSLGAALAEMNLRVLVIDLDPQGNASTGMGIKQDARETTVYHVIVADAPMESAIVQTPVPGLDAIPSTIDLAGAEIELVTQLSRETRLKRAIATIRDRYDFVVLDCPPSLGLLTVNALTAAEELVVPIQCEYYALEGLGQLLRNVSLVQQNINPDLKLSGLVMTMFDPRTKLSEQVVEEVQRYFGDLMYDVIIPRTVRLSEAPGFGQPITVYDPKSKAAECYRELAQEVATRPVPSGPLPLYEDMPSITVPRPDDAPLEPLPDDQITAIPTVDEVVAIVGAPEVAIAAEPLVDATIAPAEEVLAPIVPDPAAADDLWEDEPVPEPVVVVAEVSSATEPGVLPDQRVVVVEESGSELPPEVRNVVITDEDGMPQPSENPIAPAEGPKRRWWQFFFKGGE